MELLLLLFKVTVVESGFTSLSNCITIFRDVGTLSSFTWGMWLMIDGGISSGLTVKTRFVFVSGMELLWISVAFIVRVNS